MSNEFVLQVRSIERRVLLCLAVSFGACDRPASTAAPQTGSTSAAVNANVPAPAAAAPTPSAAISGAVLPANTPKPADTSANMVTFNDDSVGAPSPAFDGIVGNWYVSDLAGARGLKVDGGKWREGTPSVNLADQAKRLYGDRSAECIDGVKAFAFFPFAIWRGDPPTDVVLGRRQRTGHHRQSAARRATRLRALRCSDERALGDGARLAATRGLQAWSGRGPRA